jgi:hypothetical protein
MMNSYWATCKSLKQNIYEEVSAVPIIELIGRTIADLYIYRSGFFRNSIRVIKKFEKHATRY